MVEKAKEWFSRRLGRSETEAKKPEQTAKPTIYFATKSGITDDGTGGGLLVYRSSLTERNKAIGELGNDLKTQGFSYIASTGLIFEAENKEDAKNKLFSQKDNKISESDLEKLEEKWSEEQKAKSEEKKEEKKEEKVLEKYKIPEEIKKKLIGKTGVEVEYGINVDYEAAAKDLQVWKIFKS